MDTNIIELKAINKSYLGVKVLKDVDFALQKGEIHALVGQNGAGKSTLMKILCGIEYADSGEIFRDGNPVAITSPLIAEELGISIVHQEFALLTEMTVAENIFLGKEPVKGKLINRKDMYQRTKELFDTLHITIDPHKKVKDLNVADQQMVEIAKGVESNPDVLVFDEPTASLTLEEISNLFSFIGMLKEKGVSIIYISHRLAEIMQIADRVTVLRDGEVVDTLAVRDITLEKIVSEMVGRDMSHEFPPILPSKPGAPLIELQDLSSYGKVDKANLTVREGEIVGLVGLVGAGQIEIAEMIFGEQKPSSGNIIFKGNVGYKPSTVKSVQNGIAYLTESRKKDGLFLGHSIVANTSIASLEKYTKGILINGKEERTSARGVIDSLSTKYDSLDTQVQYLSGGNQQKVVLAKWLSCDSNFLIISEPTRGIDVGAKYEIYQLLQDLAAQGRGVLVISSDFKELLGICHRFYIIRHGQIVGEVNNGEVNEESLLVRASGGEEA